jgi:YcaO cyclodehydratase, ATP-ad Mg2+-binding
MGYSGVDFSSSLSRIGRLLVKRKPESLDAYVGFARQESPDITVTLSTAYKDIGKLQSTGTSCTIERAFFKALLELGEIIIQRTHGFVDRNGVAGGFVHSSTKQRAQCELVERDAFLFHYRNLVSFCKAIQVPSACTTLERNEIRVFEMASADDRFRVAIATSRECAENRSECLLIGMGADRDIESAAAHAVREYNIMVMDHRMRPGWCEKVYDVPSLTNRLPDVHHARSRDKRNLERFSSLCAAPALRERVSLTRSRWSIERFDSPIRFAIYYRVSHPDLVPLEFGIPEAWSLKDRAGPLFHPIW